MIMKRDDHVRRPLLALYHVPCPCPHPVLLVLSVFFRSVFFRSCALSPLVPGRMCEPCTPETLIEAVRGLRVVGEGYVPCVKAWARLCVQPLRRSLKYVTE